MEVNSKKQRETFFLNYKISSWLTLTIIPSIWPFSINGVYLDSAFDVDDFVFAFSHLQYNNKTGSFIFITIKQEQVPFHFN
jgi:hypothetical protein